MRTFIYIIVILFHANFLFAQNAKTLPFIAEIQLNDRLQIQVIVALAEKNPNSPITIYNGKEVYQLSVKKRIGDTIVYQFPAQDAEWRVAFEKDFSDARGWWINYNKKTAVRYPIHLTNAFYEPTNEVTNHSVNMSGNWKVLIPSFRNYSVDGK